MTQRPNKPVIKKLRTHRKVHLQKVHRSLEISSKIENYDILCFSSRHVMSDFEVSLAKCFCTISFELVINLLTLRTFFARKKKT